MNTIGIILVTVSCITHSTWNLLAKRRSQQPDFFWWMLLTIGVVMALPAAGLLARWPLPAACWGYGLASGGFLGLYFFALLAAYRRGDLSLIYPLARSAPLVLLAWTGLVMGVRYDGWGYAGVALIMLGAFVLPLHGAGGWRRWFNAGTAWAAVTAVATAGYSFCDHQAMAVVHATSADLPATMGRSLAYLWIQFGSGGLVLWVFLAVAGRRPGRATWRANKGTVVAVAVLNIATYTLILLAMMTNKVTYVVAFRQMSIVLGVLLGLLVLHERRGAAMRLTGAAIICGGLVMVAIANSS
jgi:drug/metabolite transporter (DMT)-like permease